MFNKFLLLVYYLFGKCIKKTSFYAPAGFSQWLFKEIGNLTIHLYATESYLPDLIWANLQNNKIPNWTLLGIEPVVSS